jgi:ribosome-binding protein aMBF1 (putative translation factor)
MRGKPENQPPYNEIKKKQKKIAAVSQFSKWQGMRRTLLTGEKIAASDLRAAIMGELIKARQEQGVSQKKLEELSGVKQPVIARMERGATSPQLDTVLKVLAPLGKTLYMGDLPKI